MKILFRLSKHAQYGLLTLFFIQASLTVSNAQPLYTQDATGTFCNGGAYLDSSEVFLPIIWTNLNTNQIISTQSDYSVWLLCQGDYAVSFFDVDGTNVTVAFTIGGSGNPDPCTGFSASLTITNTDVNDCTGSATVSLNGGTAPFMYNWGNTGGPNMTTINNLCAGTYTVNVSDANGCTASASGTVYEDNSGGGTAPGDTIIVFLNNSFPPNSVTDTLPTVIVPDCDIVFDSIVSAMITNVVEIPVGIMVTWSIFDYWGNVIMTYDVPYYNINATNSVYEATLIIFCDGRTVGSFEIHITDQFEFEPSTSSLIENQELEYSFVNPMQETLSVTFSKPFEGQLTLIDMKGAVLFTRSVSGTNFQENISDLSQGMYLLQIESQLGVSSVRLMK